jgi:hypothetical protein
VKMVNSAKATHDALFEVIGMHIKFFDSMIDVVEEKLERTVRHTLEVDYVCLTTNKHSKRDDRLDSSSWPSATLNSNTMGAYIHE